MNEKSLKHVRVAVLVADGFEQVEVTLPVAALRRAGADVRIISLRPGSIRGMNFLYPGRKLAVDDTVGSARPDDYGALLLPGGFVNPDLLRQSEPAKEFVRAFEQAGRPIATICHGASLLISAGVLRGRRVASWPGIADDVRNAGGNFVDEAVVKDNNWVSSRSPLDLPAFLPAMVELFAERAPAFIAPLKRPMRWGAVASRALTLSAVPLLVAVAAQGRPSRLARARAGVVFARSRVGGNRWLVPSVLGALGLGILGQLAGRRRPRVTSLVSKSYRRSSGLLGEDRILRRAREALGSPVS
jgi:protease I